MVKFDIEIAIRRCAAIEDELESLGANKLLKEQKELKTSIKEWLIGNKEKSKLEPETDIAFYDEVSNWQATVSERSKDEWDLENLRSTLSNKQKTRYITLHADKGAIKEGIDNGDLSRAKLESVGAVKKVPFTYALHIKARKQDALV